MRLFPFAILIYLPFLSIGQIAMSADPIGGTPLPGTLNPDIVGTPYLYSDWERGEIVLKNGESWKNWEIMVDIYNKRVIYKDHEGQLKQIVKPISSVKFINSELPSLIFFDNNTYQILAQGKISLLKKVFKIVNETKDYTTSRTEKKYITNSDYFLLLKDFNLTKVGISKSNFYKALPEYQQKILDFSKSHNIKKESDAILLINHLNQ
jgi:hypothetical protein